MIEYKVVTIEGVHGAGKTTTCAEFKKWKQNNNNTIHVLKEGVALDIKQNYQMECLHPQSLIMESVWACRWFQRVCMWIDTHSKSHQAFSYCLEGEYNGMKDVNTTHYCICDRGPFSALPYSRVDTPEDIEPLEDLINKNIDYIDEKYNVSFVSIYLRVPKDLLRDRVCSRVEREPIRHSMFTEDNDTWLNKIYDFYENYQWDHVIECVDPKTHQELTVDQIKTLIMKILK